MFLKNLCVFVLPAEFDESMLQQLRQALEKRPFKPCMGLDWFSEGFISPTNMEGEEDATMYPPLDMLGGLSAGLVALKTESKVLPAAVIRDFLDVKIKEIEDKELRKVGRKEKLALKEQITDDLLPRAFTSSGRTRAILDCSARLLLVDAGSHSKAESLVSKLREALPPFPAALPRTKTAPHTAMTDWLAAGEAPAGFELDSDAVLRDGSENGAEVRVSRIDLTSDEIRQHIATGKQATKLGLIWKEKIRFQLTDTLQLKRIQFLDVLHEEVGQAGDDRDSLLQAEFHLAVGEYRELLPALLEALGGLEESQAEKISPPAVSAANDVTPWDEEEDPLYKEAVAIVIKTGRAAISTLQRHLRTGYNRTARMIEAMEKAGVVSEMDMAGNRDVLIPKKAIPA
ncbi:recombination-associated protein RdgC [Chromobacterium vaccinii]|uniref:recombination-associated protein RdgC n=1 Tax=Chromobacterium vaccinii TaxID=1108595 RepID=UPI0031E0CD0E